MNSLPPELLEKIKSSTVLALPQSASKVLELSKNPDNGPPEYAVPISADPGLTAQILRFANSSFFGFANKITTVQVALSLVSVRTIRNFILWNAVFSFLPNPQTGVFSLKRLLQDALRRAVFCKVFATYIPVIDSEEIFVAGLLQDIALPILAQTHPHDYDTMLTDSAKTNKPLSDEEELKYGWNHSAVGAYLVESWGIGDKFARSVRSHINHNFSNLNTPESITDAIVALSALLPSAGDKEWHGADTFYAALQKFKSSQCFSSNKGTPKIDVLFSEVEQQYGDMLQITRTSVPLLSLPDFQKQYLDSIE